MKGDRIQTCVLSQKLIPNVNRDLFKELKIPQNHRSIGIFTADNDDAAFIAMDDATKKANIQVVYAESTYGGASCAWSKYGGEVIGIISGPTPEDVRSGLRYIKEFIETKSSLYSVNEDDSVVYYAYNISRIGKFYAHSLGLEEGSSLAYLASAPLESMYALDVALKSANVHVAEFWGPPTVTNCGGALLTGSQSACRAAVEAFANAVNFAADRPLEV